MITDPAAIERLADEAEARLRQDQAALSRPDGEPVYAPAEMEERAAAAQAACHATLAALSADAGAIVAEAEAEIGAVAAADPTARFSASELERITLRTPIVTEDTRLLSEDLQVARFRAALASTEKAEQYVYLRAGRALLADRSERLTAEGGGPRLVNGRALPPLSPYGPLADAVRELEARFLDAPRRERAEARIAAAQGAQMKIAETRYRLNEYGRRPTRPVTTARAAAR